MSEWQKKKAEELGMLFEGRSQLHRPARIMVAEAALKEAKERGRREENEACAKVSVENGLHFIAGKQIAYKIRARMEAK